MGRTINLRNIPDDLFRKFKKVCVDNDSDMTTTLKSLMEWYVGNGHLDLNPEGIVTPVNACKKNRIFDKVSLH